MPKTRWEEKYFGSTRGRIITNLRQSGSLTVEDLASDLGITDNAVRSHLAALERDRFVRQGPVRRGTGKPAYTYELTGEAEHLFPKAYNQVLNHLLSVLSVQKSPAELEDSLREVGRRMADAQASPVGRSSASRRERLEAAVRLLSELGGMARLEEVDGQYIIRGFNCPLADLVPDHPQVCQLAETLLSAYSGLELKENCEKQTPPHCSFHLLP